MKVEHSFEKTPRALIERFTNLTELKCLFCSPTSSLYFNNNGNFLLDIYDILYIH